MPRLGSTPGELGINWLPANSACLGINFTFEEVSDATNAVMDERHLEKHVDIGIERSGDTCRPVRECLSPLLVIHTMNRTTRVEIGGLDIGLMFEALLHQKRSKRPDRLELSSHPTTVGLMFECEVVRTVEPRGDLGRREQSATTFLTAGTHEVESATNCMSCP